MFVTLLAAGAIHAQPATGRWRVVEPPTLELGAADGVGPQLFGSIAGALRLGSGGVVVADGQNLLLRLFSSSGRLLKTVGGRGAGPGEFRTIKVMRRCGGDSVFVYDPALVRVSVFSPTADYVRMIDVRGASLGGAPPYDFFCSASGVMAYLQRSGAPPEALGPRRPQVALTLVKRDGSVLTVGTFPASERYFNGSSDFPRPLGRLTSVAIGSRAVYVGTGDAFEVAVYSLGGQRVGTVREARPVTALTRAHVDRYIREQVARRSRGSDKREYETFLRGLEFPPILPAFAEIAVDADDQLWIEEYPVPGGSSNAWRVYSAAGGLLTTVAMPPGLRALEVGVDYILGVWRDESDVEFVRIYRLVK